LGATTSAADAPTESLPGTRPDAITPHPSKTRHSRQPDLFTGGIALTMGLVCFVFGLFAAPILSTIFPVSLSVSGAYVAEKLTTFAITVVVAIAIYFLVIKRTHVFDVLRSLRVRLTDLSLGVLAFFTITAVYLVVTL
ncbi:MAG: hypothetical protein ACOC8L_14150, partial [Spirochaetota bacterium]